MKIQNVYRVCFLFIAALAFLPFQWACSSKTSVPTFAYSYPTPTPPAMVPAGVPVPVSSSPPASGLFAVASFAGSVVDYGSGPTTLVDTLVTLAVNQGGVSTAAVTLNTPTGPQSCSFLITYNLGTYSLSQYYNYNQYTYTPGGSYSVTISAGGYNAAATLTAPGGISYDSAGVVVTATNPGNYDAAIGDRAYQAPATTYVGNNVGYPFSFPSSAYNMGGYASPVTFESVYCAAQTMAIPGATGAFVGAEVYSKQIIK